MDQEQVECPKCKSKNALKKHNFLNMALNPAFYFLDFPFSPEWECENCGHSWEKETDEGE